jgi:G3E family GTPase
VDKIPVTLLTGFLGSGKSTLLAKLLRHPEFSDTAVVVNEFGEVGLDGILINHSNEQIVEMSSGCICCTIRGDISQTLRKLHSDLEQNKIPNFTKLVIETTGLADPAPVIHTLMSDPFLDNRYMLGGVVTMMDSINGKTTLESHKECQKQAAVADRLVLTKTINPNAPILDLQNPGFLFSSLFDTSLFNPKTKTVNVRKWLNDEANNTENHHLHEHGHHHNSSESSHDVTRHSIDIRSFTLTFDKPLEIRALTTALEVLTFTHGKDLLRMKGIVDTVERHQGCLLSFMASNMYFTTQSGWMNGQMKTDKHNLFL